MSRKYNKPLVIELKTTDCSDEEKKASYIRQAKAYEKLIKKEHKNE